MESETTKTLTFFRFEDLRIYHKALEYTDWVYNTTQLFPDNNAKDLISRFNSSAQAIALYISEGSARNKSQFIYYLKMAKSSIRECVVYTSISEKQTFLTETLVEESRTQLMEMTKMLGALIGSLQRTNHNKGREKYNEENYTPAEPIEVIKY
ncbi:MAG: four helix bundle protein, partial [Bacteroidales bacterium]|nr:four helix bundle protein [Bacteroidales bacterium]